jgi:hypothetical protein
MNVSIQIVKDLPIKQINQFQDKVVYNCAVNTRELTKSLRAYPYLSGKLEQNEIAAPITGSNKEYGLSAGVGYATHVWKMKNANWTNPSTEPQWYQSVFRKNGATIVNNAVMQSLRSL